MRRKRYMIDTNALIAAFKSGYAAATKLLLDLIFDNTVEFIGNDILIKEHMKWLSKITAKHPE